MLTNLLQRFTERDRRIIEELRRSPVWDQITQRNFDERLERRRKLVAESEVRQARLRREYEAHSTGIHEADARLKKAEEALIAARDALDTAQRNADAARSRLEREAMDLHRALGDDNDPRIAELWSMAIGLQDRLRLKTWVRPNQTKNVLGNSMGGGYDNVKEVTEAMASAKRVQDEMAALAFSAYPTNLPDLLQARLRLLFEIDTRFDIKYVAERALDAEAA